jgi:hypothetical protein
MIKLKNILFEDYTDDKDNPNKILVINKKSGEEYFINKTSYDATIHRKQGESPEKVKTPTKDNRVDTEKSKKKETPEEKIDKALTPVDFVNGKDKEEIIKTMKEIRPDLRDKLLKFNFTDWFRDYDGVMMGVTSGDPSLEKESLKSVVRIAKKVQSVALAKHTILNTFDLNDETIQSAKDYHNDAQNINNFLRYKFTTDENERERISGIVNKLDYHFNNPDSGLQYDATVYRGVKNDILSVFLKKKKWKDDGFVSTSLNPLIAENFTEGGSFRPSMRDPLFKINLKKGDPVLMLPCSDDDFCVETEITLPRDCKFTIGEFDKVNNIYTLNVEFPNARK